MNSLYGCLGGVEIELSKIKIGIIQEEDELKSLQEVLAKLKLGKEELIQDNSKIGMEIQVAQSKSAEARAQKLGLENEVGELQVSLREHVERESHAKQQLSLLINMRIEKKKQYHELHRQFKEKYLQNPNISEYDGANSTFLRLKENVAQKTARLVSLQSQLLELENSARENWSGFVNICIQTAQALANVNNMTSRLKSMRKERDELRKRLKNQNMSTDERLNNFLKSSSGGVGSKFQARLNFGIKSAVKPRFQIPRVAQIKIAPKKPAFDNNKPSMFASFMTMPKAVNYVTLGPSDTSLMPPPPGPPAQPAPAPQINTPTPSNPPRMPVPVTPQITQTTKPSAGARPTFQTLLTTSTNVPLRPVQARGTQKPNQGPEQAPVPLPPKLVKKTAEATPRKNELADGLRLGFIDGASHKENKIAASLDFLRPNESSGSDSNPDAIFNFFKAGNADLF